MILVDKAIGADQIGGKAQALLQLQIPNTPPLYAVPVSYFERAEHDANVKDQLKEELAQRLDPRVLYAVRSSAVDEDSSVASFAGVHDTYLNVSAKDVYAHIELVYASAFSQQSLSYRRAKGLDTEQIRMAVIIQEMVDADYAGVAFTLDPVTDDPDKTVIAVTKGLGDKLVDGSVSGTTYTVSGQKIDVKGEDILSKKQIRAVLDMIGLVAGQSHTFLDIEFAIKGNRAYFLQARPIAAYTGIDPQARSLLIDNANIIESYFGVTSPLTFSFAKDVYRDVYTATLRYGKIRERIISSLSPYLSEMLYTYQGKVYYNMKSWYAVTSVFPFKKSTSYMENMMGVKSASNDFKRVKMNLFDMLGLAVAFLDKLCRIDALSDQFEQNFEKIVKPYYGKVLSGTNEELYQTFKTIEDDIVKEFAVPIVNDCAVMIFFGMLRERAKRLGISPQELNRYISNGGDVASVGSASELVALVERICADPDMLADFEQMDGRALMEKYHEDSPISDALQGYILHFGARVRDELKLETVTMIEQPILLYELLRQNLHQPDLVPETGEVEIPRKLRFLASKTRKFIKNRERLRLKRTYIYSVVRNIFLAYGRNYCQAGRIDLPEDVFFLTKDEVFSGKGDLRAAVAARKAQQREYESLPTYNRVVFFGDVAIPVRAGARGEGLCGIPSGNGVVTAHVSLMRSASDALTPGNIILTRRTDPGWISLFPQASGLIVEHGSMLSHSFVVARELGLPAVVGVENATERIPDGARVTLDGLKGEITVEDQQVLQREAIHTLQ